MAASASGPRRARADTGQQMPEGQGAGRGHQPQHGAAVQAGAAQFVAVQAEQRILWIEVKGVLEFVLDSLLVQTVELSGNA